MALLRLNKKDREMASSLARQQKFPVGQSQLDHHINCVLLQASFRRRPSVSFAPVQKSGAGDSVSNKVKSSTILGASTASSKMVCSKFTLANRSSKGSAIMKATGSTWMCKSSKYDEKGFPNHVHDVIDTSIMRLVPDHDFEIPTEPEFEMLIKSAHPKPEPDNTLPGDDVKACIENEIYEENVNIVTDVDEVYDIGLFFEVCNEIKKKDVDEVYDIGLFLEICNEIKKKDVDEVYDIGLFFEICNEIKKNDIDEVYDIGLFLENCNEIKKKDVDEVYDIGLFFENCNEIKKKDVDEVYDIGLFFEVCNEIKKNDIDEVYDIGLFFENCNEIKKNDIDEVYDIGLFFEVCNQIKNGNIDEDYDIGLFFEVCNQIKNGNIDEVYDIGLFFEVCNQIKNENIDEDYDIGLFFEVCNQIKNGNIDEVYDIGLFFEVSEQLKKEDIDDVFNIGSLFEACDIIKTKEFENDIVSVLDARNGDVHGNIQVDSTMQLPRLDDNMDIAEDMFGILGVFCRSGLHFLSSGVQEVIV